MARDPQSNRMLHQNIVLHITTYTLLITIQLYMQPFHLVLLAYDPPWNHMLTQNTVFHIMTFNIAIITSSSSTSLHTNGSHSNPMFHQKALFFTTLYHG